MKKKLLFEDEHMIKIETFKIQSCIGELNDLNEFFKKYSLCKLNPEAIKKLIRLGPLEDIRELYKSKIPDINEITGLRNNKDQILKTMELPVIDPVSLGNIKLCVEQLSLFDFEDAVTLNEDRLQKHLDKFRYYSDNPDIVSAFDDLTEITKMLNKANDKLKFYPKGHNFGGIAHNVSLNDVFSIGPDGFRLTKEGFMIAIHNLLKN